MLSKMLIVVVVLLGQWNARGVRVAEEVCRASGAERTGTSSDDAVGKDETQVFGRGGAEPRAGGGVTREVE